MLRLKKLPVSIRLVLASLFATAPAFALAGCNTTEGVGEDIEAVGEEIDEAAEDAN